MLAYDILKPSNRRPIRVQMHNGFRLLFTTHAKRRLEERGRTLDEVIRSLAGLKMSQWRFRAGVVAVRKPYNNWCTVVTVLDRPGCQGS